MPQSKASSKARVDPRAGSAPKYLPSNLTIRVSKPAANTGEPVGGSNVMDMTVAKTILQQLGGGQFVAMVGAKRLVGGENSLQFAIGSGAKDNINKVLVTLEPSDTYTVEFWSIGRVHALRVDRVEDVYCDTLQDVFEHHTGFFTTLHPRR